MKFFKSQLGNSLVEMTVAMAVVGLMAVPLTGIVSAQLRIPLSIANTMSTASKLKSSTGFLLGDAVAAQSFTPGVAPEYGTFEWLEFAGSIPVAVSSRYYWFEEQMFRVLTRDGGATPPRLVIGDIEKYSDIVFNHTPSGWKFDKESKEWVYTRGRISVDLDIKRESTTDFKQVLSRGVLTATFRPRLERPAPFPGPLR